jgi:ABC-type transport system involved in multi-copper enzyme maturation permease subunit
MTGLVAAELRKLTSTVTTWVMTGIGLLLILLSVGLFLLLPEAGMGRFQGTDPQVAFYVDQVGGASIIVLVVALLSMTTEFRHGTIGRTLQITPGRTRVVVGKLLAGSLYAATFLVLGLVLVAVLILLGSVTAGVGVEVGSRTLMAAWYGLVGLVLTAWFGVALGALIRSQVVALTVTLVWLFVVEAAVVAFVPRVGRWLPFNALNAVFMSDEAAAAMGPAGPQLLPPLVGLSVSIGYVVVAGGIAIVLMRTRDV